MKLLRAGIFATALACLCAPAQAIEFLQDVPKAYPTLFKHYQALLPKDFAGEAWLYRLDGITLSVEENLMIGGTPFLHVYGCKRHFCSDNQVSLIFSGDGKTGTVKLRSELTHGEAVYYGSSDPALRRIIDRDF